MSRIERGQDRRMQRFRDVLSSWKRGRYSQLEAAELLGCSERTFRRWVYRFEEEGAAGLADRRLGKPSPKAIGAGERERVLALYRASSGLDREAFPRSRGAPPCLLVGVYVDQNAASRGRSCRQGAAAWRTLGSFSLLAWSGKGGSQRQSRSSWQGQHLRAGRREQATGIDRLRHRTRVNSSARHHARLLPVPGMMPGALARNSD